MFLLIQKDKKALNSKDKCERFMEMDIKMYKRLANFIILLADQVCTGWNNISMTFLCSVENDIFFVLNIFI